MRLYTFVHLAERFDGMCIVKAGTIAISNFEIAQLDMQRVLIY